MCTLNIKYQECLCICLWMNGINISIIASTTNSHITSLRDGKESHRKCLHMIMGWGGKGRWDDDASSYSSFSHLSELPDIILIFLVLILI